jgi:hypothetical protein
MQIKERKIAFICFHYFFRIGTFQWVTTIQIKNSSLRLTSVRDAPDAWLSGFDSGGLILPAQIDMARIPILVK